MPSTLGASLIFLITDVSKIAAIFERCAVLAVLIVQLRGAHSQMPSTLGASLIFLITDASKIAAIFDS